MSYVFVRVVRQCPPAPPFSPAPPAPTDARAENMAEPTFSDPGVQRFYEEASSEPPTVPYFRCVCVHVCS